MTNNNKQKDNTVKDPIQARIDSFGNRQANQVANTKGIIPANLITSENKLNIPQIRLSDTAPHAQNALSTAQAQVQEQNKLQELTNQRILDQQAQLNEQNKLAQTFGIQGKDFQTKFNEGLKKIEPIQKDVQDLTSLISQKTSALQNQLIDESGRRIPQAFITGRQAIINQKGTAEINALSGLLDVKNGQISNAQNKLQMTMNILSKVNDADIKSKEARVSLLKQITGISSKEEEKKLLKLKEEQVKFEKEKNDISSIALQAAQAGAGTNEIQAITNSKTKDDAIAAARSLGGIARLNKQKLFLEISKIKNSMVASSAPQLLTESDYSSFLKSLPEDKQKAFNNIPDNDKAAVAQLVSGDALMTDIVKSRGIKGTAKINKLINQARSLDPNFSINNNKLKYKYLQKWNDPNSNIGKSRRAINTSLGHLKDFKESVANLDNSQIKHFNKAKNLASAEFGDPALNRAKIDLLALGAEIASVYKGASPTESEIKDWQHALSTDFSKGQLNSVTDEVGRLLSSKITSDRYDFKTKMGYEYGHTLIDPSKKQELKNAGIDTSVFGDENTGNPQDNVFGETLGVNSVFNSKSNTFNIPNN